PAEPVYSLPRPREPTRIIRPPQTRQQRVPSSEFRVPRGTRTSSEFRVPCSKGCGGFRFEISRQLFETEIPGFEQYGAEPLGTRDSELGTRNSELIERGSSGGGAVLPHAGLAQVRL